MPTTTPKPPVIPEDSVPFIDPKTGKVTPDWYGWLKAWDKIWKQLREEIP